MECLDEQLSHQTWENGNSWQMDRKEGDCGEACRRPVGGWQLWQLAQEVCA